MWAGEDPCVGGGEDSDEEKSDHWRRRREARDGAGFGSILPMSTREVTKLFNTVSPYNNKFNQLREKGRRVQFFRECPLSI